MHLTKFCKFTKSNIDFFIKNKYHLTSDNILLIKLKKEIKEIKRFIRKYPNLSIQHSNTKSFDKLIEKFNNVEWVDSNINNVLDKLNVNYEISWNGLTNNGLNIIRIKSNKEQINKILNRIDKIIYMLEYLKTKSTNPINYNIFLILSELEKYFPSKDEIIDVPNANTGYCDTMEKYIYIWRLEEFEKVLFHETIHLLDMDERDKYVKLNINIDNNTKSYYEAITDYLGICYHLQYISIVTNISIKLLFEIEFAFIRNQAMILNEHLKLGHKWTSIITKIQQKTPAFSYYILKYLLFNYILYNEVTNNYSDILYNLLNKGFILYPNIINLESSRMTLLQLD